MRKSRLETAETRQRIVEAASSKFRLQGIGSTGLADFMGEAGLTHGGFYKHFSSKDQVVQESVALAADALQETLESAVACTPANRGVKAIVDRYLSPEHLENVVDGCPFVALSGELARGTEEVRQITTHSLVDLAELIASQLPDMPSAAARKKAWVMLSTMIGAMSVARMVNDEALSASILREARKSLIS
ncbi:TetR family transcriptional regulator [Paraburkholderia edwinii]|uniref:TetR family transcriptional regulator n=1 Tax=Paraburkholderia edwinii TaxID=2861782 RepID=A0ABX8V2N2_9BURK|nr:TetR/AcrR family transcriptional regulator [Paraburkholderia edwinii]QYD73479.1 TetR family transcriptional regulator [Paraburkholderia edwinii]